MAWVQLEGPFELSRKVGEGNVMLHLLKYDTVNLRFDQMRLMQSSYVCLCPMPFLVHLVGHIG